MPPTHDLRSPPLRTLLSASFLMPTPYLPVSLPTLPPPIELVPDHFPVPLGNFDDGGRTVVILQVLAVDIVGEYAQIGLCSVGTYELVNVLEGALAAA